LIEQFLIGLPITCVLAPVAFKSKYIKRAKEVGHCIVCWDPFIIVRKGSQYCSDQQKANRDSNTKTFRISAPGTSQDGRACSQSRQGPRSGGRAERQAVAFEEALAKNQASWSASAKSLANQSLNAALGAARDHIEALSEEAARSQAGQIRSSDFSFRPG
jgi:hypothetical protein